MASERQVCSRSIIALIILLLTSVASVHAFPNSIKPDDHDDDDDSRGEISPENDSENRRVTLSVYYESLCPYCADFIVNHLVKIFQADLISIVDLRLVPWGNTQYQANGTWICQHGADECVLDVAEACAINAWPSVEKHFSFIYCVERLHLMNRHNEWRSCFDSTHLDSNPIDNCYNNGIGYQLGTEYGVETANLNPRHRFVPWVVVNNFPLQEDFLNFISYICEAYNGSHKAPNACTTNSISFQQIYSSQQISTP
ncbi:hypothetical protein OROGR_018838 [Orobanche gracilis]